MRLPNTLFFKTASTLVITLLLLSVITWAAAAYFLLIPVGKRSADDLAALLILSAQTWTELPPLTRPDFEAELITAHGLKLLRPDSPLAELDSIHPYRVILQQALQRRLGEDSAITIGFDGENPDWIWIDIPMREQMLRFGFSKQRIGASPPIALFIMAIAILVLSIATALLMARRLSRPLAALSAATSVVGRGETHRALDESGPDEIATLARNFNRMGHEVAELLENRTTLLAGISHDLRTPLTRIRLALELQHSGMDSARRSGLEGDVAEMEQLLEQSLLLARGMKQQEPLQERDLVALLGTLAAQMEADCEGQYPDNGCHIEFDPDSGLSDSWPWPLPEQSLLRVLRNLLENALRYGDNKPITIRLQSEHGYPLITILDRGQGIPEDEREAVFRPFYRVEHSRNLMTGGSGLGLAIVQQICQAQNWEISLHPRSGGGCEVRLLLGRR
jgi:two-component system osmolarity sensor histidine kinase EnvZ